MRFHYLSITFLVLLFLYSISPISSNALFPIKISKSNSFFDLEGNKHVVGTVRNEGFVPLEVVIALKIQDPLGRSQIALNPTFAKIIFPFTEAPFKFDILKNDSVEGIPFIHQVREVMQPSYDILTQNYTTMNTTTGKNLVGTIKNIGDVVLHNVSVYASVHNEDGEQIDSVKTDTISTLRPGEEVKYTATPDPAVQSTSSYFSCAGFDINAPINTISLGNGKFIPYSLESAAKITDFAYNETDDSLYFNADHYNPAGGIIRLSFPEASDNHTLNILLDSKPDFNAKIEKNGKTVATEIFVPPESHTIAVKGLLGGRM